MQKSVEDWERQNANWLRYLELLIVLLASLWLGLEPSVEPSIVLLVGLAGLWRHDTVDRSILADRAEERVLNHMANEELSEDAALLQQVDERFPGEGTCVWLRDHDFGQFFNCRELIPIEAFVQSCDLELMRFSSQEAEDAARRLHEVARDFLEVVAVNTFRVGGAASPELQGVPKEWRDQSDDSERYWAPVRELNRLADEMRSAYAEVVALGRRASMPRRGLPASSVGAPTSSND